MYLPPAGSIPVHESPYLRPESWGYYIDDCIITPNAARLVAYAEKLGIDRRTGELRLLPGEIEST